MNHLKSFKESYQIITKDILEIEDIFQDICDEFSIEKWNRGENNDYGIFYTLNVGNNGFLTIIYISVKLFIDNDKKIKYSNSNKKLIDRYTEIVKRIKLWLIPRIKELGYNVNYQCSFNGDPNGLDEILLNISRKQIIK